MFKMLEDPILIDPGFPPPQIYIRTGGLVVEHHDIWLPAHNGAAQWQQRGTNVPDNANDDGTPDIYVIPEHHRQGGNMLEISIDLFNVTKRAKRYSLTVEVRQGDYEDDVLISTSGSLPGQETKSFVVFAFLELMA